jgi:MoaA/NifB/PqqE/SkfB family radical SAM enzyme
MPRLPRTVGAALDLWGCPNRCRHCYLGSTPNGRLPKELLREIADAFWTWKRPEDSIPWFEQVDVSSSYREPDYCDDYKALYDLERSLSHRTPRRWELLSVWRLVRDPEYAHWAAKVGPKTCQLTFFGGREKTDWFAGRPGVFSENLKATDVLLDVGIIPRWQIILTKPAMADLPFLMSLARTLKLRERAAEIGGQFDVFANVPSPDGEAFKIEHLRIEPSDFSSMPEDLLESTRNHFGGIGWETERAITERALSGEEIPAYEPEAMWFFVNSNLEVFTNFGDLTPGWRLGRIMSAEVSRQGRALRSPTLTLSGWEIDESCMNDIVGAFESDAPPAYQAAFHVPDAELAERFGRRDSFALYTPGDLKSRWIRLFCDQAQRP